MDEFVEVDLSKHGFSVVPEGSLRVLKKGKFFYSSYLCNYCGDYKLDWFGFDRVEDALRVAQWNSRAHLHNVHSPRNRRKAQVGGLG